VTVIRAVDLPNGGRLRRHQAMVERFDFRSGRGHSLQSSSPVFIDTHTSLVPTGAKRSGGIWVEYAVYLVRYSTDLCCWRSLPELSFQVAPLRFAPVEKRMAAY